APIVVDIPFSGGYFSISTSYPLADSITVRTDSLLTAEGHTYTRSMTSNLVRVGGVSSVTSWQENF
ncbi:MAG: hypothetical protein ABIE84_05785, partial [bacterium]